MKKSLRKLAFNKETIRSLASSELKNVLGGRVITPPPVYGTTTGPGAPLK